MSTTTGTVGSGGAAPPAAGPGTLAAALRRQGLPGPWWCLALLTLAGAVSRWLTRCELVQVWDAGNFVLALDGFAFLRHRPHLPGPFWLLIELGRGLRPLVGGNGVAALEAVNALVSALALPFGWVLGFRFGGLRTAWWMAALLFSAPLLWYYASQPLSYGPELGWVVAIGCCAWCLAAGDRRFLPPLALLMATAGGIRPNTPLFLLPLVLVCCWRGWRQGVEGWRFLAAVALGLGALAWWAQGFLAEVGGLGTFWPLLMTWKGVHRQQSSDDGFLPNGWLLLRTIALTAPGALALLLLRWRQRPCAALSSWRRTFLLLWVLPSALYFLLVHFTRMGHATTLLPAVLLALALALGGEGSAASPAAAEGRRRFLRWPRDLLAVLVLQSLLFLLVPGDRFAASLRDFDREWGMALAAARRFDPATTLVVTAGQSNLRAYRLPSVHLPAYDHDDADFRLDQLEGVVSARPPLRQVVVLDRGLAFTAPELPGVRRQVLIPGRLQLITVPVPPDGLAVSRLGMLPLAPERPSSAP